MVTMQFWMSRQFKKILDRMARRHFGRARGYRGQMVRRAVLLMDYLSKRAAAGDTILIRDRTTGEVSRLAMAPEAGGI